MTESTNTKPMLMSPLRRPFARKSVEQMHAEHAGSELKKSLGPLSLIFFGIGTIIGTGIFVLTGKAAAQFAGPGIMISFVITGILCIFVALSYAELASAIPVSGSAYSYSYASMGEFVAWIMGLLLLLEYGLAASTVAVGWTGYVASLLHDIGWDIPIGLRGAPGEAVKDVMTGAVVGVGTFNLPAMIAIAAVTLLLVVGVSESAVVNNIIVLIKVSVVIAFIAIGWRYVDTRLWHPLVPAQVPPPPAGSDMSLWGQMSRALVDVWNGNNTAKYGIGGLILGAARIFFAYIGFEAVSTTGAESKNPKRDLPIGILGSLLVCTVLYILTSAVLVGIVPYTQLDNPAPIAMAVNHIGLKWFAEVVKIGAICGLSSVMLILLYGQTRIFYTMARDGLIPGVFAIVNKRTKTPWVNTIVVGTVVALVAGLVPLDQLADLTNVGTLAAFIIVCLTVVYLRFAKPGLERPFKTPLFPVTPILGAIMCAVLLKALLSNPITSNFFLWYLLAGAAVYFVYGLWFSKLGRGIVVTGHEPAPESLPE